MKKAITLIFFVLFLNMIACYCDVYAQTYEAGTYSSLMEPPEYITVGISDWDKDYCQCKELKNPPSDCVSYDWTIIDIKTILFKN